MNHPRALARLRPVAVAGIAAGLALLGLLASVSHAGRQAGTWGAREFQVQNLSPWPVTFTARLTNETTTLWSAAGTLPANGAVVYQPQGLPPGLTGTLAVVSRDEADPTAGAIAHLEQPGIDVGNEVFEMRPDAEASRTTLLPWLTRGAPGAGSSVIYLHSRSAAGAVTATLTLRNPDGQVAYQGSRTFAALASFDLATLPLPPGWEGSGVVESSAGLLVQAARTTAGASEAYTGIAPADAASDLVLPWVAPTVPTLIGSYLYLFNPGAGPAQANVALTPGGTLTATVPALGVVKLSIPALSGPPAVRVLSSSGLAAVARMEAAGANAGLLAVPAFAAPRLTSRMAAPLLYAGFQGWSHLPPAGAVRVYNASDAAAQVTLTYRSALSGTSGLNDPGLTTVYTITLGPRGYTDDFPPPAGAPRWSLQAVSDQPVAVTVVGFKTTASTDRWFAYRGEAYVPREFRVYLPAAWLNFGTAQGDLR